MSHYSTSKKREYTNLSLNNVYLFLIFSISPQVKHLYYFYFLKHFDSYSQIKTHLISFMMPILISKMEPFFMNLSNVLIQTSFILSPYHTQMALLSFIGTVYQFEVPVGTEFLYKLSLTYETSPCVHCFISSHVFFHWQL